MSSGLPAAGPQATGAHERRPFPDLVRGAALLGIGLVNVHIMSAPYLSTQPELNLWTDPANVAVLGVVGFFFQSTAFVVFSLLFGAGFCRLMEKRAEWAGAGLGFYWRRLAVLAALGALHIVLLWFGDVLLLYALCGAALLLFRDCRERTLWIWIAVAGLTPLLAMAGMHGLFWMTSLADADFASPAWRKDALVALLLRREELVAAYGQGSWSEVLGARLSEWGEAWWALPFFAPQILAAMLLGMILGKRGVLDAPERHAAFYRRAFWTALPLAIAGKGFFVFHANKAGPLPDAWAYGLIASSTLGGLAMALVYLAALRALWLSGAARRLVEHVKAAGRMALTHYLGQSLIATTLFYSYGLGWYGTVNNWQAAALMSAIYAAQVALSPAWLRRYPLGPVEWLARRISYGRARPPASPPPLPPPLPRGA